MMVSPTKQQEAPVDFEDAGFEDGLFPEDTIFDTFGDADDVAPFEDDAYEAQFDDDPNPYLGTYSEE